MAWLHLELSQAGFKQAKLTDDDGDVIAVLHTISVDIDHVEIPSGFEGIKMKATGSGKCSMDFDIPNLEIFYRAIRPFQEDDEIAET